MTVLIRVYRLLNVLSIDVALGAVASAAFFARILAVQLLPQGLLVLGITVWIIYSTDHLLDARKLKKEASSTRHLFHQRHFKLLTGLVLAAVLTDLVAIAYIRRPVFSWGIGLAIAIVLYLLFHHLLGPLKEIIAALLYSAGVLLPSLVLHTTPIPTGIVFLMFSFYMTALINLVLFSWFEVDQDQRDAQYSLATIAGQKNAKLFLYCLFLLQALLVSGMLLYSIYRLETLILFAMNGILLMVFVSRKQFTRENYYRLAGDVVFLFPLAYLIVHE